MPHPVFEKRRIFAPGPTPVPEEVLSVMSRAPLHHRTHEFIEILSRTRESLKYLFQTKEPVYIVTSSGTGAMEAALVNCLSPSDEVLVIEAGKFGERWKKLSLQHGLTPHIYSVEWGRAADPNELKTVLKQHPSVRAVLAQATDTSTAVSHPTKELAEVVHAHSDALFIVDAISELGVSPLPMDDWGIDVLISGSQKSLMLPPGLAFLSFSKRAQEARKNSKSARFYFDLNQDDISYSRGQELPWTPAVSLVCALDLILENVKRCGLEALYNHHARLSGAVRAGVKAMGLEIFAKERPSNALTAVCTPAGIDDGKKIVAFLRDHFSLTIAGGQDHLAKKIFRLAHLGFYDELDVITIFGAVEIAISSLGGSCPLGRGVGAVQKYFIENP